MCLLAKASIYKECLTPVNKTLIRQVGKALKQIKQLFMEGKTPTLNGKINYTFPNSLGTCQRNITN